MNKGNKNINKEKIQSNILNIDENYYPYPDIIKEKKCKYCNKGEMEVAEWWAGISFNKNLAEAFYYCGSCKNTRILMNYE